MSASTTTPDTAETSDGSMATAALLSALRAQQARVTGVLDGLDDEALRRPVLPSGWSCLGMLQHLTSMTTFWFQDVMHGTHPDGPADDDDDDEFAVPDHRPADDVVATYRQDVAESTASVEGLSAATPPAWWPEGAWGGWRLTTLVEVLVHVLVETSTHAGHLDAVRELLDGAVWDYTEGRPSVPSGPVAAVTA